MVIIMVCVNCRVYFSGTVGEGATVTLSCAGGTGTPGRYLIVQIPGKLGILTLCEVQVFGNGRSDSVFQHCKGDTTELISIMTFIIP